MLNAIELFGYSDCLQWYKDEDEYTMYYNKIHNWDGKSIRVLRLAILQALNYFNGIPIKSLNPKDFYNFFDLNKNSLKMSIDRDLLGNLSRYVWAIDSEGDCLIMNDIHVSLNPHITHVSKLHNIWSESW